MNVFIRFSCCISMAAFLGACELAINIDQELQKYHTQNSQYLPYFVHCFSSEDVFDIKFEWCFFLLLPLIRIFSLRKLCDANYFSTSLPIGFKFCKCLAYQV